MAGTGHDEWILKLDLLSRLISKGVVRPEKSVRLSTIRSWFPTREEDVADEIVDDFIDDSDAPIEYSNDTEQSIWITDIERARDYLRDIDRDPDWFRPDR